MDDNFRSPSWIVGSLLALVAFVLVALQGSGATDWNEAALHPVTLLGIGAALRVFGKDFLS